MLILLFIFALIRHLQGAPTTIPSILGCELSDIFIRDDPTNTHLGTRGVNDIVVSCVATIFACTWTAIHPNIPSPCDSGWEIFKRQVTTMVYAILAPEAITAWALWQHLAARRITREYNDEIAKNTVVHQHDSFVKTFVEGVKDWFRRKPAPQLVKEGEVVPWTITHGFFQQMGGFVLCEGGKPTKVISNVSWEVGRLKSINAPRITEAEIEDRSKGDGITKTIVVLQTTWFIAQCIVRWSASLPVTELEVLTLGFAMLNGITYALWWHKPQSVRVPVYLEKKGNVGGNAREQLDEVVEGGESQAQDEATGARTAAAPIEEEARPAKRSFLSMFYSAFVDGGTVWIALSATAFIFGLIHLIPALFLDFPSHPEMLLWRISAGIITVQPIIPGICESTSSGGTMKKILNPIGIVALLCLPLYIIARLTLIILAFLSLRTVHNGALVTVAWLSFIPHL